VPYMNPNFSTYFTEQHSLDTISISAIEQNIMENPIDLMPKLILAKKMTENDNQELLMYTNDRTLVHYLKFNQGNVPSMAKIVVEESYAEVENGLKSGNEQEVDTIIQNEPYIDVLQTDEVSSLDVIQELEEGVRDTKIDPELEVIGQDVSSPETLQTDEILEIVENQVEMEEVLDQKILDTDISLNVDLVEEQYVTIGSLSESEPEVKKKKKKKSKQKIKNKYKLKEYSGLTPYSKWLLKFKSVDIDKKIRKEEKTAKKLALEESANKSIRKSKNIISEALADLLVSQGHLDDAKKMYEHLMVKYPEKSSYFAAKINQLIKI